MKKPLECGCYGLDHHSRCKLYEPPVSQLSKEYIERFVGTGVGRAVWNAALDEAAIKCDAVLECVAAARIRELKK